MSTTLSSGALTQDIAADIRGLVKGPVYPLKASINNRYLVDQNDRPFLMVGDSPQHLIANLSPKEAAIYMANRQGYGINALWINLLCSFTEDGCDKEAKTFDGIAPFYVSGDLGTPNPQYFERARDILDIAAHYGMVVLLDPAETISWLAVLRNNGGAKAFAYGQYLGINFKHVPNIIWMHGNDLQSWRNAADTGLVQAVARGIRSVDNSHIHTVELNFYTSGSLDDPRWAPLIELNAAYTYYPTYAQVLREYNRSEFKPVFMVEAHYEFEQNFFIGGGSSQNLRRQEYWTMLSGATGQLYGSAYTWRQKKEWDANLDTPGVHQLRYMKDFFVVRRWYDLVPDEDHVAVTAGFNALSCFAGKLATSMEGYPRTWAKVIHRLKNKPFVTSNTCATAARTPDGSLIVAYVPTIRTITVEMSKLTSSATARWYDPTNGEYVDVKGSPFENKGSKQFRPPASNNAGDGDWVLVLEAQTVP